MRCVRLYIFSMLLWLVSCSSNQAARDIASDLSSDMKDSSTDLASDMSVDLDEPAYRRTCIVEDAQSCKTQNMTQFGDCGQRIGVVFDGHQCVEVTGCEGCKGEDCPMFKSIDACISSCAQNGWCQSQKLPYLPPAQCGLTRCVQSLNVCLVSEVDPTGQLSAFGQANVEPKCIKNGRGCAFSGLDCAGPHDWCCRFDLPEDSLTTSEFTQLCALTLNPNVTQAGCLFYSD